jgi:predicted transposase/invertase (TIGR01784 family)
MTIAQKLEQKGRLEGQQEGRREGLQEGEHTAALKIARSLLANGMDRSTVLKMTGISEEDMVKIQH